MELSSSCSADLLRYKQIINNPGTDHIVYLKAKDNDNAVTYLVKYERLREIDQYVFAFICPKTAMMNVGDAGRQKGGE